MKSPSRFRSGVRSLLAIAAAAATVSLASPALAQTVACGCSTTTGALAACLNDFSALPADPLIGARIVDDIFETSDHHDARALTFARYLRGLAPTTPGGPSSPLAGCIGSSNAIAPSYSTCAACNCSTCSPTVCTNYACTSAYDHTTDVTVHEAADGLDWRWWQLVRGSWESSWTSAAPDVGTAPPGARDCADINDVAHCSYNPVYGFIYDLGGEANRAAIFPITDHTTDSCLEAIEWSVWLTDNPDATTVVRDGEPPDPMQWNRARLDQIFLQGWTRNPQALGNPSDTHDLRDSSGGDAQSDSPTVLFSLPCGVTFRYASVLSGNFGNPGPECEFNSSDDEIDAVAGLNADNTRICPDLDMDGHRDAACGGDDCNDTDPSVHPGATERCSATVDVNCDGSLTGCPSGTACIHDFCAASCIEGACATDFTCTSNDGGASGCVPTPCVAVTCGPGEVCGPAGCQDPCAGARCPAGQFCRDGSCVDPCNAYLCPPLQHCEASATGAPRCIGDCPCIPCTSPAVCSPTSHRCEQPPCGTTTTPCVPPDHVDCTGETPACVGPCTGILCPLAQSCVAGQCVRDPCFGVGCQLGLHCEAGQCIPDGRTDAGAGDSGTGGSDASLDASGNRDGSRGDARSDGGTGAVNHGPCGCRTPGRSGPYDIAWLVTGIAAVLVRRRRR